MADEELQAAAQALFEQIMARPKDRPALVGRMREAIGALRAAGLAVPAELLQFEDAPADDVAEDFFDNMPI